MEMSHREEMVELSYQMRRVVALLVLCVVRKVDAFAPMSLWREKEALKEIFDMIIIERENLLHELTDGQKLLRKVGDNV